MKFSADQYVVPVLSDIHIAGGATGAQASIDRFALGLRSFHEIEAVLLPSGQFDDADSVTIAVEHSPDNSAFSTLGTFKAITNDDNGLVAAFALTVNSNKATDPLGEAATLVGAAAAILLAAPQQLDIVLTDTTPSVTELDIRVTGTDADGNAQVKSYAFTGGGAVITAESWKTITEVRSINGVGVVASGDEVLDIGITNSIKAHVGRVDGVMANQFLRFNVTASAGATQTVTSMLNFLNAKNLKVKQPYGSDFSWLE